MLEYTRATTFPVNRGRGSSNSPAGTDRSCEFSSLTAPTDMTVSDSSINEDSAASSCEGTFVPHMQNAASFAPATPVGGNLQSSPAPDASAPARTATASRHEGTGDGFVPRPSPRIPMRTAAPIHSTAPSVPHFNRGQQRNINDSENPRFPHQSVPLQYGAQGCDFVRPPIPDPAPFPYGRVPAPYYVPSQHGSNPAQPYGHETSYQDRRYPAQSYGNEAQVQNAAGPSLIEGHQMPSGLFPGAYPGAPPCSSAMPQQMEDDRRSAYTATSYDPFRSPRSMWYPQSE